VGNVLDKRIGLPTKVILEFLYQFVGITHCVTIPDESDGVFATAAAPLTVGVEGALGAPTAVLLKEERGDQFIWTARRKSAATTSEPFASFEALKRGRSSGAL
jgi:hypothetical protein